MTVTIKTKNELIRFLRASGTMAMFISVRLQTMVEQRKNGNPYYGAIKCGRKLCIVNVDFVRAVRRKIAKLTGRPFKKIRYQRGPVWYFHVMTRNNKPLPLCVHNKH